MTPEGKVKLKIDAWINKNMPDHWKVKVRGGPFGKTGTPDILMCWQGIFIAIEVKSDAGELTGMQLQQLKLIKKAGGVAAVVKGYDVERLEVIKQLVLARIPHVI